MLIKDGVLKMGKDLFQLGSELDNIKDEMKELRLKKIDEAFDKSMVILQKQLELDDIQVSRSKDILYHTLVRVVEGINQDFDKYLK